MHNMSSVRRRKPASRSPIHFARLVEISLSECSPSEERLLLRELSHRINNEFASAIGVISLAAARSNNDEVRITLDAVQDRLQSYAQVHHVLQMPEHGVFIDASAYLDTYAGLSAARNSIAGASNLYSWNAHSR
jgi:two-component sensor histidine kinase